MIFEWDHEKSEENRIKRHLPFSYAAGVFEGQTLEFVDNREDHGEVRLVAIGQIGPRFFVVTYTDRAPALRRIISARLASKIEVQAWHSFANHSSRPSLRQTSTSKSSMRQRIRKFGSK